MAGSLPTKDTVQIRGDAGPIATIGAASERAAGVMTARHVEMLSELWSAFQSAGQAQPLVVQRSVDTSQFLTRAEARELLRMNIESVAQDIANVRAEIASLPAPATADEHARNILSQVIENFAALSERIERIDRVVATLGDVAEFHAKQT